MCILEFHGKASCIGIGFKSRESPMHSITDGLNNAFCGFRIDYNTKYMVLHI